MAENMVHIPEELMAQVQQIAASENRTLQELVREAVETHLRRKRLQDLYAYGEAQARKLGIEESDVDGIVEEERRRWAAGGR